MTKKTAKEAYTLTPFGLLSTVINEGSAQCAADALTLYMLRHARPGAAMGIVVEYGHMQFVHLAKVEDTQHA